MTDMLALSDIRTDAGTQPRAGTNSTVVDDYTAFLLAGIKLPPVTVFHDGTDYLLADGFHRYAAHQLAKRKKIAVDVRQGTHRDAVLFSLGANRTHGLQSSPGDKRRAIEKMLRDDEWVTWSDNRIAEHIGVSQTYVSGVRRDLGLSTGAKSAPRVTASGRTINTANIGRKPANVGDADVRQEAPDDDMPVREIDEITDETPGDQPEQASADLAGGGAPVAETAALRAQEGEECAPPRSLVAESGCDDQRSIHEGSGVIRDEGLVASVATTAHEQVPASADTIDLEIVPAAQMSVENGSGEVSVEPTVGGGLTAQTPAIGENANVSAGVTAGETATYSNDNTVTLTRAEYDALVKRASASPWLKVGVPMSAIEHCCSLLRSATKAIVPEDAAAQYVAAMFSDDITGIANWFWDFEQAFRDRFDVGTPAALERDAVA